VFRPCEDLDEAPEHELQPVPSVARWKIRNRRLCADDELQLGNEVEALYRERNHIERFFNKLKQYRRIATRYDKLGASFLAFVKLAAVRIWLRSIESTA
jgi:transposase